MEGEPVKAVFSVGEYAVDSVQVLLHDLEEVDVFLSVGSLLAVNACRFEDSFLAQGVSCFDRADIVELLLVSQEAFQRYLPDNDDVDSLLRRLALLVQNFASSDFQSDRVIHDDLHRVRVEILEQLM